MFINRSSREINLRVVLFGPSFAGKGETLGYLYRGLPEAAKGRLISVDSGSERTLFFDFSPPGLGEIRGFRVRLHLYALSGEVRYLASPELILKGVDGVVFVADSQRERLETNVYWRAELDRCLRAQGRDPASVPLVFQLNKHRLSNAASQSELSAALGAMDHPILSTDALSGEGVFDVLKAITRQLLLALKDDRLHEVRFTPEESRQAADFMARARLVGHYGEHFGDTLAEYEAALPWPDGRRVIVVAHGPAEGRPYWTYATAGLSLKAQPAGGPQPQLELLAYAQEQNQRVADVLIAVAQQIAGSGEDEAPYKIYDTLDLEGLSLIHSTFVLAPAPEAPDLLEFPAPHKNPANIRFTVAAGAEPVTFVALVPVSPAELAEANALGTPALLEKQQAQGRARTAGWQANS